MCLFCVDVGEILFRFLLRQASTCRASMERDNGMTQKLHTPFFSFSFFVLFFFFFL